MDLQTIEKLTSDSISRMTSEVYLEAHNDPTTGKAFIEKINAIESSPRTASRPRGSVRDAVESAPTPANTFADDPSWADAPVPVVPEHAPAAAQPVGETPAELELMIHEYQPTDKNGKPVGGIQRFEYRTQSELIEKLTKAHSAASSRIRELSRNQRLETLVASAKSPAALSSDVPETKEELAKELVETRHEAFLARVQMALADFKASRAWDQFRSPENAETLVLAVQKSGDDPRDPASFHKALENMKEFLIPVAEKIAVPAPTPAPVEQAAAATVAPAPTQRVAIATGISSVDSFNSEESPIEPVKVQGVKLNINGKTQVMDLRSWDRLPSEQQRHILRNPSNARAVDALYEDAEVARRARR